MYGGSWAMRQSGIFITAQLSMHSAGATTMECDVWEGTRRCMMPTGSNYPTPVEGMALVHPTEYACGCCKGAVCKVPRTMRYAYQMTDATTESDLLRMRFGRREAVSLVYSCLPRVVFVRYWWCCHLAR
jgi:hypothetical protein